MNCWQSNAQQELRAGPRARRRHHGGDAGYGAWAPWREWCWQIHAAAHLFGLYEPSEGHVEIDGERVAGHGPVAARRAGIAMIHQELQHVAELTVAQTCSSVIPSSGSAVFSSIVRHRSGGRRSAAFARPDHRSGSTDPHPQGRPAPDRRNRPRRHGRRQGHRHGRADVQPDPWPSSTGSRC